MRVELKGIPENHVGFPVKTSGCAMDDLDKLQYAERPPPGRGVALGEQIGADPSIARRNRVAAYNSFLGIEDAAMK